MGSEWILGKLAWGCELDSTGSGLVPVAGCCECGDEPSGSCATELGGWNYNINLYNVIVVFGTEKTYPDVS
jgi:hypothetical protein